jgi:hypothetical protein
MQRHRPGDPVQLPVPAIEIDHGHRTRSSVVLA